MTADVVTREATIVAWVDQWALVSPQTTAVVGPDGALTYTDLSVRSDSLARHLRHIGVRPGDLVGLCLGRSVSLVVGALAIMKAGCAYVAIDPSYPDDRMQWMLDDSGATAVVTDAVTAGRLGPSGHRPRVMLSAAGVLPDGSTGSDQRFPERRPQATDLAYVVYTSGSTGRPKGVLVEHASLSNLVEWHRAAFALDSSDRCSQIASPGFDAAVWEIWPCLASGATLHVVPDSLRGDPVGLRDWLVGEAITVSFLPTAVAEGLLGLAWPESGALRYLLTGGDALTRRPPPGLGFTLVNNYGLSETAVVATSSVVEPEGDAVPSIGRPIAGVQAFVVDENLQPVNAGEAGELMIGGVAVARGYLNRPELTGQRFVNDGRGRRYRTGDRVRLRPDGAFEFLGRLDDQLSIRGFRVEPGEVSAALNAHPAIAASVLVGVGTSSADRQLVAYVVASGEAQPSRPELHQFLGAFLPEHLLPSRVVWLDEMPLTAHGKIDRDALPAPLEVVPSDVTGPATTASADAQAVSADDSGPPTPTEVLIASVLAELLDVSEIGRHENFFLLGGHSMLGAQLIVRLESLFQVEISLRYLFDHPTLAEIAAQVEREMAAGTAGSSATG